VTPTIHACGVALSSTHHMSIANMSSNGSIISILGIEKIIIVLNTHVTGIHEYSCNGKSCNRNNDSGNMKARTIKACIHVNPCNSDKK